MNEQVSPAGRNRRQPFWPALLAAASLLWPAVWNGYPIVFADTGTYLSQAINHHLGWDRPPFYSLFMLPLHAGVTTWPVIGAQSLLAVWVFGQVSRRLLPSVGPGPRLLSMMPLAFLTWLPFLVCQLMPDLFTPLLVLALCLLAAPGGVPSRRERWCLTAIAGFAIAAQQSSLLLAMVLSAVLALLPNARRRWLAAPSVLAVIALLSVSLFAYGRISISPFGNVFLLARVIYDGPGMDVLRRDCPAAGWRLCPLLDRFPPTSDEFLWRHDSPILLAGGHKAVSTEANAIIAAALRAEPWTALRAVLRNGAEQLGRFASGDGLQPWPEQVTPWIERDFPPAERQAYAAGRQARGLLAVPRALALLHAAAALTGIAGCIGLLPAALRRRHPAAAFLLAALAVLPASALITGGLSTPHDRYQSRVMWLPPYIAMLSAAALIRRRA